MSKHLEHLRAKIQYTEILWPQIQKPSFILAQELVQRLSVLEQMAHALNSIPLLHWSPTQQECGQGQPQLCLSTLDEILCFPLLQQNKHLRRNSTYWTPEFNSSTRSQQIQIQPSCKKAQNPLRAVSHPPHLLTTQVLPALFHIYYAHVSGTTPQNLIFAIFQLPPQ